MQVRYDKNMEDRICERLLQLNRQFYARFASSFSDTRQRLQPGVIRILEGFLGEEKILDLGCGNGELWQELNRRGHSGRYVGLDFSSGLLEIARMGAGPAVTGSQGIHPLFLHADLSSPDWCGEIPENLLPFDIILAFAVLHHLPGEALRRKTLLTMRGMLSKTGKFIHSEWQFLNSTRLRDRIQPWSELGIRNQELDAGDYLLDWRHEGRGLRYVHHFEKDELIHLAQECGFKVIETFESDGEGGRLGLYQVWEVIP